MKKITLILTILIFIPSLCNSSVMGKGLICKKITGLDTRNYPFYIYFHDLNVFTRYDISGYKIKKVSRKYELISTNKIWLKNVGTLNRETLELETTIGSSYSCKGYKSKEEVINKVKKFIENGKSKNKF